jgi:hypothetical protein
MSIVDKSIQCSDCGATFTFTAGEQEFYATKGLTHEPKRCSQCRQTKKQQIRGSGNDYANYNSQSGLSRQY